MKFLEIVRFELDYRLRRPSTWLFLAAYIALVFSATNGMLVDEAKRAGDQHVNGPAGLAFVNVVISMMGLLIPAAIFSGAALRDLESRMHPLFATSPITRTDYVVGRFTGALLVNVLLVTAVPFSMMLFTRPEFVDADLLGPFHPAAYLRPFFYLLLPNVFISGALLFTVAVLTRRALPVFAVGAFLFLGSMVMEEVVTDQSGLRELGALLEPFGFSVMSNLTEFWTPFEKNTKLLTFDGALVSNRLFWLGAGALALAFTRFRYRTDLYGGRGKRRRIVDAADESGRGGAVAPPPVSATFNTGTRFRQMLSVAAESFQGLVLSRDFLLITFGLMAMVVLVGATAISDDFGTPFWPMTQFIAPFLCSFLPATAIALLTAFYAGELVHRERDAGLGDIAEANPVPDWAFFTGKLAALGLMLVALKAVLMISGILLQAAGGYFDFEVGLYLQMLFGLQLSRYLIFAVLAMLLHVLVNNKYFGHLLVVLCYLFTIFASRFGLTHNLLVYGGDSGMTYSDISGFGPFMGPTLWFRLYWLGWAIVLAVLANLLWLRGRDGGMRKRLRLAGQRFGRGAAMATVAGLLLAAGVGRFIYYNTNVLNDYRNTDDMDIVSAEYERRYSRYGSAAQPTVNGTKLHVELYPERREAQVRGTYALVNKTTQPIRTIHLFLNPEVENRAVSFGRQSRPVIADRKLGHHTYELAQALAPGQSLQMTFDVQFKPRGFTNSEINTSVVQNGTYFDHSGGRNPNHRRWLPLVGYQRNRELSAARVRKEHGLPERPLARSLDDASAGDHSAGRESIRFEAVIGTAADQTAVAPGTLRRSWIENGRRYFHYIQEAPTKNAFSILSAKYAVHEETWRSASGQSVRIEIFHHPTHTFNVPRMTRSVRASLDYFTKNFGPYPLDQIRIVEFPRYASFAYAYAGTISFAEAFGWLHRIDETRHFDLPSAVVAHEVAHQWWGYQVVPAPVEGAGVLSEVLAQYSALMVTEKIYGSEMVGRFLGNTRIEYLNRRGRPDHPEVPLLYVASHPNLVYRKGPLAMYALRAYIGEEALNAALRRLLQKHGSGQPPFPTSRDLYRELKASTSPELHYLLHDFLETTTLWNLRTSAAAAAPIGGGKWRVTMDVAARKMRVDGIGRETEAPMNDLVEIGVYAATTNANETAAPLYLQKQRIRSGTQRIVLTVDGAPGKVGVDPNLHLIDRNWGDNVRPVLLPRKK